MAGMEYECPLCCKESFTTKQDLVAHLGDVLEKLQCPICCNKLSSVVHLLEHLSLDNCKPENSDDLSDEDVNKLEKSVESEASNFLIEIENNIQQDSSDQTIEVNEGNDDNIYVDLLDKQVLKPGLVSHDLKLIKAEGGDRYMIVANDDAHVTMKTTIVTKQNNDGTISLTSVEEEEKESTEAPTENETFEVLKEIYTCNTCGVSFTSVMEHIQNYHGGQEVVVEEPLEQQEVSENESTEQMDYRESPVEESTNTENPTTRRVITETGDIVEAPLDIKMEQKIVQEKTPAKLTTEKDKSVQNKRFVQVDQLCDSVVKDIKPTNEKKGPYHRVIIKEAETEQGNKVKLLHCLVCQIYVSELSEFKSYPCKILKYVCQHCSVSYDNSQSLCAHMKVHKGEKVSEILQAVPPYECNVCCTMFPTNKSLKLHKRMHDPIKSRPFQQTVDNDGTVIDTAQYECTVCEKTIPLHFKTIHMNSHKASSDAMNCRLCNKKFTSLEYLEMHMNVHNLDKIPKANQDKWLPYSCLFCNRRFARPHEKVKHERIHTGEKPHSCEICGKSFRVSYCLTLHMRTHTGARPYACPHCPKRFKAHSVYNHHLLTHSEVRAYKCPFCPKAFKTAVQLAGHKNSHTKPFSCQQCNRPFASLYAVRIHTETHARQNNLKFSCSLCGASYARAFALKDHVKQVHNHEIDVNGQEEWMKEKTDKAEVQPQKTAKSLSEEVLGI